MLATRRYACLSLNRIQLYIGGASIERLLDKWGVNEELTATKIDLSVI